MTNCKNTESFSIGELLDLAIERILIQKPVIQLIFFRIFAPSKIYINKEYKILNIDEL
jgi:hypothetical protein